MSLISQIKKWYNRKFRGVVYAEDSVPMSDNEFMMFLNMTPEALESLKKEKESGNSLSQARHWHED